MAEAEKWTVGRLLTWTTDFLRQHGADSPRIDAEVLLAHARGCSRIELYTVYNEDPGDETRATFRNLVKQRAAGTPVAYLVGYREFYSLPFKVTPDVLIPRPETEMLVVALLDKINEEQAKDARKDTPPADEATAATDDAGEPISSRPKRSHRAWQIADVGTGSGILAVCAAKHLPAAEVTAIDISPAALAIARENAERHGVADRIHFIESNVFAAVPTEAQFDFILSNPPYVRTSEMAELPREVAQHEPHLALEAGPEGTDVIAPLLEQSLQRLRPGGWLFCELSPMIAETVRSLAAQQSGWESIQIRPDTAGHLRMLAARRHL